MTALARLARGEAHRLASDKVSRPIPSGKKRLLLVSHAFPPSLWPESILVLRTVRALEKLGWEITVLTTAFDEAYSDSDLEKHLPPTVRVVRLKSWEGYFKSASLLAKALRRVLFLFGLPEINLLWLPGVMLSVRSLVAEGRYDAVHTWASPHASNVAGLLIKRFCGLPWVVHFSDPWADNPYTAYSGLRGFWVRLLEKAIIRDADAVVFVTNQASELVMKKYPVEWKGKVRVIPHGHDRGLCGDLISNRAGSGRMRLIYVGSFYAGLRTPDSLFRALCEVMRDGAYSGKIELALIGPNAKEYLESARTLGLADVVSCSDSVPFRVSVQAMADSDVLVLIDAPCSDVGGANLFLPSKLVDYLMLKKPILGITPLSGASADLLRSLNCPVIDPDDVAGIAESIRVMSRNWSEGTLHLAGESDAIIADYDIHRTTAILDGVLAGWGR